jgi:hypothetical protein
MKGLLVMWRMWEDGIKVNVKGVGYVGVDLVNEISI